MRGEGETHPCGAPPRLALARGRPSFSPAMTSIAAIRHTGSRAVLVWLLGVAAMVFIMAIIGAITRLTESGLSIMEWAPFSGALPPMSEAEWQRLFELYRQIPQYQLVNAGMTLEEFREIFWWEWIHRQWGRLIGLAFLLPFLWFLLRGRLPAWLKPHGWALLALGALQGAMGWFMVASGFAERTEVSQYRLALHLGLALLLYGYLLWLAFRLAWPAPDLSPGTARLRRGLKGLLHLLILTLLSGALVAGLNAGMVYNTYPLMDGRLVPAGYWLHEPWFLSPFENVTAVQFNHRVLTLLTALLALVLWARSRSLALAPAARKALTVLALLVLLQMALGVATLLAAVPVSLGALHQAGAILVLTATLAALYLLRHEHAPGSHPR